MKPHNERVLKLQLFNDFSITTYISKNVEIQIYLRLIVGWYTVQSTIRSKSTHVTTKLHLIKLVHDGTLSFSFFTKGTGVVLFAIFWNKVNRITYPLSSSEVQNDEKEPWSPSELLGTPECKNIPNWDQVPEDSWCHLHTTNNPMETSLLWTPEYKNIPKWDQVPEDSWCHLHTTNKLVCCELRNTKIFRIEIKYQMIVGVICIQQTTQWKLVSVHIWM